MYINTASINAHQGWMNNSASNVANVNSEDAVERQSTIASQDQTPKLHTTLKQQDVALEKEMVDQMVIDKSVEANTKAIRTEDEMKGTVLDMLA